MPCACSSSVDSSRISLAWTRSIPRQAASSELVEIGGR